MKYRLPARITPIVLALTAAAALLTIPGCGAPSKGVDSTAASTTVSGSYAFWPIFPDEPRVQFLRSFGSSDDVSPSQTSALEKIVFGKEVEKTAMINKPYGVAMKGSNIYVCDIRGQSLVVLDLKKKQTRLIGVSGVNRLNHPVAVAVSDDGTIYVADNERGSIMVYDAGEHYTTAYGFEKFKPVALAVHADRLYACDLAGQSVVAFDRLSGKRVGTIGTVGDGDGQFRVPLGVATDKVGNVYVSDMMSCRVQKFSPDGKFLSTMGKLGDHPGAFARPKHIAVDADGIQYIVDAAFQNVQMFDDKQRVLMAFGASGDFPGSMDMPAGITVTDEGLDLFKDMIHPGFVAKRLVLVTNQFGPSKVSVYALGQLKQGWTAQQLASVAAPVSSGTGMSEDRIKLQQAVGTLPDDGSATPQEPDDTLPPKSIDTAPAKPTQPANPKK